MHQKLECVTLKIRSRFLEFLKLMTWYYFKSQAEICFLYFEYVFRLNYRSHKPFFSKFKSYFQMHHNRNHFIVLHTLVPKIHTVKMKALIEGFGTVPENKITTKHCTKYHKTYWSFIELGFIFRNLGEYSYGIDCRNIYKYYASTVIIFTKNTSLELINLVFTHSVLVKNEILEISMSIRYKYNKERMQKIIRTVSYLICM